MNPGNGIETLDKKGINYWLQGTFKLMNPGNGIETREATLASIPITDFQINESWKRD